jgi:hypothetical protein
MMTEYPLEYGSGMVLSQGLLRGKRVEFRATSRCPIVILPKSRHKDPVGDKFGS